MPTPTQQRRKIEKLTVWFGYGLFVVVVLGVITGTVVPWFHLLFEPQVLRLNVTLTLVAFVTTAILPALLSYILGDRATRRKDALTHHVNGVAFGVATYWLSLLCGLSTGVTDSLRQALPYPFVLVASAWPILAIVGVMAIVAATYSSSKSRERSVLYHTPYQVVLLGGALATFVTLFMGIDAAQVDAWLAAVVYGCFVGLAVSISYWRLSAFQRTVMPRLTQSAIAVSIGIAVTTFVAQIIPFSDTTAMIPTAAGIIAWVAFLVLATRR